MLRKLNLTLLPAVDIDAGDATDIEAPAVLATLLEAQNIPYSIDDLAKLRDAFFELTLGTETGSGSFTLDSFSGSVDGTNYRIIQRYSEVFTAAGIYQIPITEPLGDDLAKIRWDVTVTQLSGSHKFASSSLKLKGNLWLP